jgi:hypothetical protein
MMVSPTSAGLGCKNAFALLGDLCQGLRMDLLT